MLPFAVPYASAQLLQILKQYVHSVLNYLLRKVLFFSRYFHFRKHSHIKHFIFNNLFCSVYKKNFLPSCSFLILSSWSFRCCSSLCFISSRSEAVCSASLAPSSFGVNSRNASANSYNMTKMVVFYRRFGTNTQHITRR